MSAIGQALAHRELLIENRQLANLFAWKWATPPESVERAWRPSNRGSR
jgi:hypothetical protein